MRLAADAALARSVIYRTLTLGLQRPTEASLQQLTAPAARRAIEAAARLLDSRRLRAEALLPPILDLVSLPVPETALLSFLHDRLFGHAGRGLVCPYETEYGTDGAFGQPQELADIAGYYRAFGLRPPARSACRLDHVACECEFMDFLCRKEAFTLVATEQGARTPEASREAIDVILGAARGFLRDHLGRFGRAFGTKLAFTDRGGFFGGLGQVLVGLLGLETERMDVRAGPAALELRPPAPEVEPMACGTCPERIQVERGGRP